MIELDDLMVMQYGLRNSSQIAAMIDFVQSGGFWTKEALKTYAENNSLSRVCPVIEIAKFPDGKLMVHDGNHRTVSVYLGGREYLREDEYIVKNWSYEDYLEISFENNWVTPFDPRTEIRVADIGIFKKKALEISKEDKEKAIAFILDNKLLYSKPRSVYGIKDLVKLHNLEKNYETCLA